MEVRYNRGMSLISLAAGIVLSWVHFANSEGAGNGSLTLTAGFILLVFCLLTMTRPYFTVDDTSLELRAILGPGKTTYTFESIHDLEIDKNQVYFNHNGERKAINIAAWMVEKNDWQKFVDKVNLARG